jgi:hypothetical protein
MIGFYALHTWMLALFDERAQQEAFATRPFLAPAPLTPTGWGVPTGEGVGLTGRWSWATGVMHGNWIIVGALCGAEEDPAAIYPALAWLPAGDIQIEDVWHTDGLRATGSNDVVITDVFVPGHRLVRVSDIYAGTAPGAGLHDADTYRRPMVAALALLAAMPALGSADRAGPPRRGPGKAMRCAGFLPTRSERSKPALPQAIPCHGQRPLPRQAVAADQAGRRRDLRPRSVRLRHQSRTRGSAHTGYEGATDRNGVKGLPCPTTRVTVLPTFFRGGWPTR